MDIQEGKTLSKTEYNEIMKVLRKRCKERALYLLERKDKTKQEVFRKLSESGYPLELIYDTLAFLEKYDYINDERYVKHYLHLKKNSQSERQIFYELVPKGIPGNLIKSVLSEEKLDSRIAIKNILAQRRFFAQEPTREQKNRQIQYLLRKGFFYEDIIAVIKEESVVKM